MTKLCIPYTSIRGVSVLTPRNVVVCAVPLTHEFREKRGEVYSILYIIQRRIEKAHETMSAKSFFGKSLVADSEVLK